MKLQKPKSVIGLIFLISTWTVAILVGQETQILSSFSGQGNEKIEAYSILPNGDFILGLEYDQQAEFLGNPLPSMGKNDFAIVQMNREGTTLGFSKAFGGAQDDDLSEIIATEEAIYIAGSYRVALPVGEDTLFSGPNAKGLFIMKMDFAGSIQWVENYTGTGLKAFTGLAYDGEDGIWVSGYFEGSFEQKEGIQWSSRGRTDGFLFELNDSGELKQHFQFGQTQNTRPVAMAFDRDNQIYLSGWFDGSIEFNTTTLTANSGDKDLFLVKINPSDLNVTWSKKAGGVLDKQLADMVIDQENTVWLYGNFIGVIQLEGTSIESQTGNDDLYLISYNREGTLMLAEVFNNEHTQTAASIDITDQTITLTGLYQEAWTLKGNQLPGSTHTNSFIASFDKKITLLKLTVLSAEGGSAFINTYKKEQGTAYLFCSYNGDTQLGTKSLTHTKGIDAYLASSAIRTTQTEDQVTSDIQVYPTLSKSFISITGEEPINRIERINQSGSIKNLQVSDTILVSDWTPGIYYLVIYTNKARHTRKIIIPK